MAAAVPLLLLLIGSSRARAMSFPDCLHQAGDAQALQNSVEDIEACQDRTEKALDAKKKRARQKPSRADADRLHVHQKAEIKTFLQMTGVIPGDVENPEAAAPPASPPGAEDPVADATRPGKMIRVDDADLQALDPGSRRAVQELRDMLNPVGPDGRVGLTPAMIRRLEGALKKSPQGESPDVKAVLDRAENGDGRLTPEALKALMKAGLKPEDLRLDPTKAPAVPDVK